MNIQYIVNSCNNYNLSKNMQNFKGRVINFPEIPNDTFELSTEIKKSNKTINAKETIAKEEAFQLYLASTNAEAFCEKPLGSEDDIDDIVIVFDNDKALPLKETKETLVELKDGESMEIRNWAYSENKSTTLLIPKNWNGKAEITKKDGQFYIKNLNPFCKVGVARKSETEEAIKRNKASLEAFPPYTSKCFWKTYCHDSERYLEKNKRTSLGNMKDLVNSKDVLTLPGAENKYVAFMPGAQKGIAALKDGESVIIGRRDKDDENNSQNKIIISDDIASRAISRKHLLFENIGGELFVTDISKYGTLLLDTNVSLYNY